VVQGFEHRKTYWTVVARLFFSGGGVLEESVESLPHTQRSSTAARGAGIARTLRTATCSPSIQIQHFSMLVAFLHAGPSTQDGLRAARDSWTIVRRAVEPKRAEDSA